MKRLQKKQLEFRGEITAFLSLIFILIIALTGVLIESASIHLTKNKKRMDTNMALESVFAEYHQEAWEQYDLFIKEGSEEDEISKRLAFYGADQMEHQIQRVQLLSDSCGQAFYEQAVSIMRKGESVEIQVPDDTSYESEELEISQKLEGLLEEEGKSLPEENNPIYTISKLKQVGLLSLVIPDQESLSNRYVKLEELPSSRVLKTGTKGLAVQTQDGATKKLLFAVYLEDHFSDMTERMETHPLAYEVEYLLGGKSSDKENLEAVAKKILSIRVVLNYAYLLTDEVKQMEAEAMALGLSSLFTVPGATGIVKQALLLAWAYGEGIVDLQALFDGGKLPLVKTQDNWQLQLSNLTKLGSGSEVSDKKILTEGMDYGDYLKALLFLEEKEDLCMRALDLLELNLGIKVDECVTGLEIKSTYQMRRGIQDQFLTEFIYQ